MAITKGAGATVIASTASTTTSSAQNSSADYVTEVYISMVISGTATGAATVQIQVAPDGDNTYYSPGELLYTAPLAAGTYYKVYTIPVTATRWKAAFTQQSGGTSSTVVVQSNNVTAV